jgi:glycosyltransferase involved in cell wall biosynthesis
MRYKIVVAAYNSPQYITRCLKSIENQTMQNIDVCVGDDASESDKQKKIIKDFCERNNWKFIFNEKRLGVLHNQYNIIQELEPNDEDVLVWVDGDDALHSNKSIEKLNSYYEKFDVRLTYGNYRSVPYSKTCPMPREYPERTIKENSYRKDVYTVGVLYNHLRTVKYDLFKRLDPKTDFQYDNGEWFKVCADPAVMIPCLEMAGPRHMFIKEVLYDYTSDNSISEWRQAPKEIDDTYNYIVNKIPKKEIVK